MKTCCGDNDNLLVWKGADTITTAKGAVGGNGEHGALAGKTVLPPGTVVEVGKDLVFTTDLIFVPGTYGAGHYFAFSSLAYSPGGPDNNTTCPILINWVDLVQERANYNLFLNYSRLAITDVFVWLPEAFYDDTGGLRDPSTGHDWGVSPDEGSYAFALGPISVDGVSLAEIVAETGIPLLINSGTCPKNRGYRIPFVAAHPNTTYEAPYLIGRYVGDDVTCGQLLAIRVANAGGQAITIGGSHPCRLRITIRGFVC
jgi:hypothetical protein